EYTLTFRVKSNRPTRVSLWGKRTDGKPWRLEIGAEPPADTWRQAKHVFRPPAAIFSGAPLQFGCSLDFLMPGDGRTELDDVALKPSAGDGE
ncbi:MAG TPA: hypothetical protein P5137_15660, partial [Candidatus Brocadiia bacterium]|nr:hypothetical protein [Candidatus Brocadiia bacterium]